VTGRALRRGCIIAAVYALLAGVLLAPLVLQLGSVVPGAPRSDVWNSLWSYWFVADSLSSGELPWHTKLLDHPRGGVLFVADPLGALLAFPFVRWWGVAGAYGLVVWFRIGLLGTVTHWLAEEIREQPTGDPWVPAVAGVSMMTSAVVVSGLHNGTSEALALAPIVLASATAMRAIRTGCLWWGLGSALMLIVSTLASGYAAVLAFVFVGSLTLFVPRRRSMREELRVRIGIIGLGLAGALPLAMAVVRAASAPGNLVGIKHSMELSLVRRTTGPADPWVYFRGFDFRSPDFRAISRYGEDFIHCTYIGWVLLAVVAMGVWTRREHLRSVRWIWVAGGVTFLLSLGPVIVHEGLAWVFLDDRVWPMPYLLLERLPGLGSLSLLWRLGAGPALGGALLAAWSLQGRKPVWAITTVLLVMFEALWVAPTGGMPAFTDARVHSALVALRDAPPGAVLNHPVVGGRAYLHEQTTHGMPLAARLNFPNNGVGKAVWEAARRSTAMDDVEGRKAVQATAEQMGVRYVVLHEDPLAAPDMYDHAAEVLRRRFPALPSGGPRAHQGPLAEDVVVLRLF